MRIEVDDETAKKLDSIKSEKWIGGKGHTETIRYLIKYREEHQSLAKLIDEKLDSLEKNIVANIFAEFRRIFNNLLGGR